MQQQQQQQQQQQHAEETSGCPDATTLALLEAARAEASAALAEDPSSHKALYRRASVLQLLGQLDSAVQDCCHALQLAGAASVGRNETSAAWHEIMQLQRGIQHQHQQRQQQQQHLREQQVLPAPAMSQGEDPQLCRPAPRADPSSFAASTAPSPPNATASSRVAGVRQNSAEGYVLAATRGMLHLGKLGGERHLTAGPDGTQAGTDVLEEQPAAFVLRKDQRARRCVCVCKLLLCVSCLCLCMPVCAHTRACARVCAKLLPYE